MKWLILSDYLQQKPSVERQWCAPKMWKLVLKALLGAAPTLVQFVSEVDSSQWGYVGEVALPVPVKEVSLQRFREQDPPVVRGVHGPKVGVCGKRGRQCCRNTHKALASPGKNPTTWDFRENSWHSPSGISTITDSHHQLYQHTHTHTRLKPKKELWWRKWWISVSAHVTAYLSRFAAWTKFKAKHFHIKVPSWPSVSDQLKRLLGKSYIALQNYTWLKDWEWKNALRGSEKKKEEEGCGQLKLRARSVGERYLSAVPRTC